MPEQPPDPRHYDMRIPPVSDTSSQQPQKSPGDEADSNANPVNDSTDLREERNSKDQKSE